MAFVGVLVLTGCGPRYGAGDPQVARSVKGEAAGPGARGAALEHDVFELVNRHRRAHGLTPFALDARISRQARLHSVAMAKKSVAPGHDGFDDRVQALRRVMSCAHTAENVAVNQGYREPAAQAVRGWLGSRGHRENIEGPYQSTGIGVASDDAGNVYFTQIFVGR